ncbi:MAG TPA: alpha/beta hydrolase [Flavobacteriaceae bacterium]|nr:alpha/beta hydrolase [Flavobacteriaceae bacterium]
MSCFKTKTYEHNENVCLYYEDYGEGQPIILIHGWPLSHKMWEYQIAELVAAGYRVIAYDRRGFGQSDRPWNGYDYDTLASDLNDLIGHLELKDVILIGFSMGGGEVARYIGIYGTQKISKAVLIGAVTPFLLKTDDNPDGVDADVFEGMKEGISKDRPGFFREFGKNFMNYDQNKDRISEAQLDFNWNIACHASPKGTLDCVDSFGKTDFREDCKKFDIPTLVVHGDADNIVPIDVSGAKAKELIPNADYKIIENAPHGLMMTHRKELNKVILDFLKK